MSERTLDDRKRFLRDLYAGPFRGHGLGLMPQCPASPLGDFTCSTLPVAQWVPSYVGQFEAMARTTEELDLDMVPYVNLNTNTGIFAAAFGCALHVYTGMETNAAAKPAVFSAAEADALPSPDIHATPTLARILELASLLRDRLGPDAPIGVPDIQSPFDIAALIWNKESLFMAMIENPDAVHRLVAKCRRLLIDFLKLFCREIPAHNLSHCPGTAWAPPELGCWLSEDEVGAMSTGMFEEFVTPSLVAMSEAFGGIFVHCCAAADHQYANFLRIPNLRGLNRVFQYPPGPVPAIKAFSGKAVLIQAWLGEQDIYGFLERAQADTRFYFELPAIPIEEARPVVERVRAACRARSQALSAS
jgi:hypothetical protein